MLGGLLCMVNVHSWDVAEEYPIIECRRCERESVVELHPETDELWM